MNHKTDMQAPTEIYVWFADNKGIERDGERFIRAWTNDPARADGLRDAIGRAPTIYRATKASQDETDLCERIIHAVEGECDGLAITEEQASNILAYLQYEAPIGDMSEAFGIVDNAIGAAEFNEPEGGNLRIVTLRIDRARQVRAALASRPDAQADEIRAADPGEELQGWSVTVERNGVRLLTIEKDSVGGVENIGDFAPLVRDCAEHLLSFIGRDAQADERGALMCERLRAMGLNPANEAADLIEQMSRAAAPLADERGAE